MTDALRIADRFESITPFLDRDAELFREAAAELRRLAAEIETLQNRLTLQKTSYDRERDADQAENESLRKAAGRALEAWDITGLPVSGDGMLQERMECLRAALAARPGKETP